MRNVDYSSVKQRISSYRSYKLGISHRQVMRFVAKLDLCPNDYCKRNGLSVSRENLTISPSSSSLETILQHNVKFVARHKFLWCFRSERTYQNKQHSFRSVEADRQDEPAPMFPQYLRHFAKSIENSSQRYRTSASRGSPWWPESDFVLLRIWHLGKKAMPCLSILGWNRTRKSQYLPQINKETQSWRTNSPIQM